MAFVYQISSLYKEKGVGVKLLLIEYVCHVWFVQLFLFCMGQKQQGSPALVTLIEINSHLMLSCISVCFLLVLP